MATSTYTAATLKTCRNGTSWRSDHPYAGFGQGYTYDSISNIGYIGFSFNLAGKHITKISFTFEFSARGLGSWATKAIDFYRYIDSTSPTSTVGSFIGGFSSTGMYNCTSTFTFDASHNTTCFNGLKDYFESGGSVLIIKAPSTDKTASGYNYTECYGQIASASVTIDYVNKYKITYDVNGGSGTIGQTELASDIAGKTTTSVPTPPGNSTSNKYTVTYNGNGGTASRTSDTNKVTYTYKFDSWNTAANGSGTSYGSNATITITDNLKLYAQYSVKSTSYSQITSATATKNATTNTRTVTLNFNGNGTSDSTLSSSATTTYSCTGWYTAISGGTKRVNTGTDFTPSSTETLYAQYTPTTSAYNAVTLPIPSRTGHTFGGWADGNGTIISSGGSYTPSATITLTAKWVPNQCALSVVDRLNGEIKYSTTVDYGTQYTLPSYNSKITELTTGTYSTISFTDDETGYSNSEQVPHIQSYIFNNQFGKYENGQFSYADEGREYYSGGETVTITTNTEFSMVFAPDTVFIKFTVPPAPTAPFGKRFQGWQGPTGDLYSVGSQNIIYDPSADEDNYDFIGIWIDSLDNYGKNLYFKINGAMKQAKTTYVKANGQYQEAVAIFVKVNGRWKTKEG